MYLNRDGLEKFVGQGTVGLVKLPVTLTHLFLAVADDDQATTLLPLLHSLKRLKLIREYPSFVNIEYTVHLQSLVFTRLSGMDYELRGLYK